MPNRGEALGQAQARSDGPPQPALDPLLAHFSAMGMAQVPPSVRLHVWWFLRQSLQAALHVRELTALLACFWMLWAMSESDIATMLLQNARQNTPLPQQQQTQLGQGLGSFGGAGPNAGQQNTLASLLAGAYSQSPGEIPVS